MKRLLSIVIAVFVLCGMAKGERTIINESLIYDVKYTYQLVTNEFGRLNCVGELEVYVNIPEDASFFIFERTPYGDRWLDGPPRFLIKEEYPITTKIICKPEIYWGTYFSAYIYYKDGSFYEYAPTFAVNSYIAEEDLALLEGQHSTVEEVANNSVNMNVVNGSLYIETLQEVQLSVFDITGKNIFSGPIHQSTTIPLDMVGTPFIIVKYTQDNIVTTKKLIVK